MTVGELITKLIEFGSLDAEIMLSIDYGNGRRAAGLLTDAGDDIGEQVWLEAADGSSSEDDDS